MGSMQNIWCVSCGFATVAFVQTLISPCLPCTCTTCAGRQGLAGAVGCPPSAGSHIGAGGCGELSSCAGPGYGRSLASGCCCCSVYKVCPSATVLAAQAAWTKGQ